MAKEGNRYTVRRKKQRRVKREKAIVLYMFFDAGD
jgi:hypothetical protein